MNPITEEEWIAAKASMPWKAVFTTSGLGGEYRLVDRRGKEVPLPIMVAVMERVTNALVKQ